MIMQRKNKRALTLLEIMVVIFLIGMIGGVVGVNMKKSMDKAKVFRTETAIQQLEDVLNFALADNSIKDPVDLVNSKDSSALLKVVKESGLVRDAKKILVDGWGNPFVIAYNEKKHQFSVKSTRLMGQSKKDPQPPPTDASIVGAKDDDSEEEN
jgi:type II secretory pathway pseudopilin PulG